MTDGNEGPRNIDELLRMRSQLDQELHSKYSKEVSVLFTDIKGSTTFFETRGDLEGRAMVQTHNDLLFPIIERHGGSVIKTIGDAIMATFQAPQDAVETSVDMQRALDAHNRKASPGDRISVRIGINHGKGLVEKTDVYGDVVNVAARVESLADGGEVLVTESVYKAVRNSDDILLRYHSTAGVKGKSEPIEVYRVVWQEDMESGFSGTAQAAAVRGGRTEEHKVLTLEFTREGDAIKLSASEKSSGQEKTLRHYEEKPVSEAQINDLCDESIALLKRANNRGKVSKEILTQLKEVGQKLYDILMTPKAKELMASTRASSLIISMDDRLVHIPWEMLFDGDEFLCLRFAMGRLVATRQSVGQVKQRALGRPLKMLILSDPKEDLKAAYREGVAIRDNLEALHKDVIPNLRSGPVDAEYAKGKLRNYDVLHYAGHADYDLADPANSGWLMNGGKFTAKDVIEMSGSKPMPALVFSNACHSGQTGEWSVQKSYGDEIYGLANAFLLSGVQHYVGTFWEILDEPSAAFAIRFYSELMAGAQAGEALRQARMHLVRLYGEDNIVWSSYMLYGDPTFTYKRESGPALSKPAEETSPEPEYAVASGASRATAQAVPQTIAAEVCAPPAKKSAGSSGWLKYVAFSLIAAAIAAGGLYLAPRPAGVHEATVDTGTASHQPAAAAEPPADQPHPPAGISARNSSPSPPRTSPVSSAAVSDGVQHGSREASAREPAEKRQRVQELARQLVARYRERAASGTPVPPVDPDAPVTLSFVGFTSKGDASGREGEDEYLLSVLQDRMVGDGKIQVVERELLDGVLAELDLSSSDLADQKTALKVGRILSAKYIATGSLMRLAGEYRVSLRVIETETTALKTSVTASGKGSMDVDKVAGTLADGLEAKLAPEKK